jgi:hypothetical protein
MHLRRRFRETFVMIRGILERLPPQFSISQRKCCFHHVHAYLPVQNPRYRPWRALFLGLIGT